MADDSEIDLYDNLEDNWKRENIDIYDDVETQSTEETVKETTTQNNHTGRRVATYVGNLRWWTTDQDLLNSIHKLSIKDILEIKFHENRQNGQSKGFCVMVFGSDKSAKEAMEKLPKTEINGLAPIVTFCNKQNLNYFEQAAGGSSGNNSGNKTKNEMNRNNGQSSSFNNNSNQMQMNPINNNNMKLPGNMSLGGIPGLSQNLLMNLSQNLQNSINRNPNMMVQNPISTPLNITNNQMSLAAQRILQPGMMMQPGSMQMTGSGPTPHLNPNFFTAAQSGNILNSMLGSQGLTQSSSHSSQYDSFGRNMSSTYGSKLSPKISDGEFEEILQRNKTVSSSAISRAVLDASAGDYASAIETLVTAISLIKQSKIASDSRCKVLINSLQDTLTGIESKSYGTRKTRNRRSFSESSSDGDRDESNEYGSSRRVLRSRSRDRRRRSRDYGTVGRSQNSNTDFFTGIGSGSSDRYNTNRYRH